MEKEKGKYDFHIENVKSHHICFMFGMFLATDFFCLFFCCHSYY